jgi:diguanylate cyclase (GGDEF)-like protein
MGDRTRVIIVDPDENSSAMLKASLSAEGYCCDAAASAVAALDLMSRGSFQVMLADIGLPGGERLSLVRRARKLNPQMAIVVMADDFDTLPYDTAIEAGASDFIRKPVAIRELTLRFAHVMRQERLRVTSITDELTGLSNRRGFYTLAEQQLKLSRRQHKGIYVLYADVDGLKAINDTWGHLEGDHALVEVAGILKGTYRESDIVARIGGDEFVVIPIGSTGDNLPVITDRLKKSLEARNATSNRGYDVCLSFGVAYYDPANPCTIDDLLSRADKSMYEHKKR